MTKAIGGLIMANAGVVVAIWLYNKPTQLWQAAAIGFFGILTGAVLFFHAELQELTIKLWGGSGTLKLRQRAAVDADAIASIRKRVEAQSATVDLAAESAAEAHALIENLSAKNKTAEGKIKEIETAGTTIQETITELQETAKFFSTVVAAQTDDRHAFNTLVAWIDNKSYRYRQPAADAVVQIRAEFGGPIKPGFANVPWPQGTDPEQLPLERLRDMYQSSVRLYKTSLVHAVWKSKVISKKAKMAFFVEILEEDDSLGATFYAGKFFVKAAGDPNLKWGPFSTKALLDWWQRNSITVEE